ncbi:hypothetical protein MHYP_G00003140 [Metynnis hypsauchen]
MTCQVRTVWWRQSAVITEKDFVNHSTVAGVLGDILPLEQNVVCSNGVVYSPWQVSSENPWLDPPRS